MGNRRHTVWDTDWLGRKTSTTTWDDGGATGLGGVATLGVIGLLIFGPEIIMMIGIGLTVLWMVSHL